MTRLVDDRPARPQPAKEQAPKLRRIDLSRLAGGLPLLAFASAMLLIGAAPTLQPVPETTGRMQLPADAGYRAVVARMAQLGLFRIERLPALPSQLPRETLVIDDVALARAMTADAIGHCGGNNLPQDCKALIRDYRTASYLGDDMVRLSRSVWSLRDGRVEGMRPGARSLLESGRDIASSRGRLLFSGADAPAANVLVDARTGYPFPEDGDCPVPGRSLGLVAICLGERIVLRLPSQDTGGSIRIDGIPIARRAAGKDPVLLLARPGQVLTIIEAGSTRAWQIAKRATQLSEVGGNGERVRYPGFSALAAQIDSESLIRDLRTSIRKPLQDYVQNQLEAALNGKAAGRSFPVRGSVLLMDGLTGEIATAATFPLRPGQIGPALADPARREAMLAANQNFEPLEIGSTAKVPFYAAILPQAAALARPVPFTGSHCMDWPRFLQTGKAASGSSCAALLRDPARTYEGGQVGVEQAIGFSNNFYAVSTLRAGFRMSDKAREGWLRRLNALACDDPVRSKEGSDEQSCPIRPWQGKRARLRGPATATVDFDFPPQDVVRDPYGGLFLAILGNGNWKWSNVQLAQAYARLLTGRKIRPRLLATDQPLDEISPLDPQVKGRTLELIRNGMQRVVTEGTASKSFGKGREAAVPGRILLAKTGTPTLPDGSDGTTFVLAAVGTKRGTMPERFEDICAMRMVVVNLQVDRPGHDFVRRLIDSSPALRRWLAAPDACRAGRSNAK